LWIRSHQKKCRDYSNIHQAGGKWTGELELRALLENHKEPVRVIFSSPTCPPCKRLEKFIKERNLDKRVVWINSEERWVRDLARMMAIEIYPTMVVVGQEKSDLRFDGIKEIVFHLINIKP
jgi:glutaredoxin